MIWQRRVRIGLAVAGVACAAVVYLLARDRPSGPPPVSLLPTDRAAIAEGGITTSIRLTGPSEDVLSADAWKEYDDRTWYENPRMLFRDGTTVEAGEALAYKSAVGSDTPGKIELSRSVRVVTEDGLELQAELATYDSVSGIVNMPGDVRIVKGRLTATGVGGLYDRSRELFKIEDQAHAVVAPAADGGDAIDATARAMTMARQEHFLRLEERARIARPAEVLAADTATIYFTEATEELRLVDLSGRATVTPVAGAPGPSPDMRGDTISLMLHPEGQTLKQATLTGNARLIQTEAGGARVIDAGWIDLETAPDGRTLNGLRARQDVRVELPASADGPSRTIRSSTLVASGSDARGLERARFEGGVDFVERPAGESAPRTGRSRTLVMALGGGFDAVEDAEFLEQVHFASEGTTAAAERAVYAAGHDRLMLFTVPNRPAVPHATSDSLTVDARTITLRLGGDEVSASGDVRTQSIPDQGDGARGAAFFEPGRVVLGLAEEFHYVKRDGLATYTGREGRPARLQQDGNEIVGATILLRDPSGDLSASGGVESVFVIDPAGPPDAVTAPGAPAVPYRIRADALEYREAERTATYTGAPVTLKSGEAETEALRVVLRLSAGTREVERVEWHDGVYMLFEKQYEAKGDRLTYDLASGAYVLDGRPAITKLPDSGSALCVKATGLKTTFNRRTNQAAWPAQDNTRGANLNVKIPCTTSIR